MTLCHILPERLVDRVYSNNNKDKYTRQKMSVNSLGINY